MQFTFCNLPSVCVGSSKCDVNSTKLLCSSSCLQILFFKNKIDVLLPLLCFLRFYLVSFCSPIDPLPLVV